ncbi:MAG: single-stranded DNA-binding protein [Elusimicrobiota bacterium]
MKDIRLLEQNIVLLSGRLGADPDFRATQSGRFVCHFRMAASRNYKDKSGDWKEEVAWVPVSIWGEAAERLKDRLKKGSPVHVEGRLKSREYEDKSGQKRQVLEIEARRVQFLAKLGADDHPQAEAPSGESPEGKADADIEEVPF